MMLAGIDGAAGIRVAFDEAALEIVIEISRHRDVRREIAGIDMSDARARLAEIHSRARASQLREIVAKVPRENAGDGGLPVLIVLRGRRAILARREGLAGRHFLRI